MTLFSTCILMYAFAGHWNINADYVCIPLGWSEERHRDLRLLASWWIKGTGKSSLSKNLPVPLIHHVLSELKSVTLLWNILKERTLWLQDVRTWIFQNVIAFYALWHWKKAFSVCYTLKCYLRLPNMPNLSYIQPLLCIKNKFTNNPCK